MLSCCLFTSTRAHPVIPPGPRLPALHPCRLCMHRGQARASDFAAALQCACADLPESLPFLLCSAFPEMDPKVAEELLGLLQQAAANPKPATAAAAAAGGSNASPRSGQPALPAAAAMTGGMPGMVGAGLMGMPDPTFMMVGHRQGCSVCRRPRSVADIHGVQAAEMGAESLQALPNATRGSVLRIAPHFAAGHEPDACHDESHDGRQDKRAL